MLNLINTAKFLHYVDTEGEDSRDTYRLYRLLGSVKAYIKWSDINNARPGDKYYELHIDECMLSTKDKQDKLSFAANGVVHWCNKLKISEKFFEKDNDLFIERFEVAEAMAEICDIYGISLQRNFYEKAKSLEG